MTKKFESEVEKMGGIGRAYEKAGRIEGRKEGRIETLFQLVNEGDYAVEKAAAKVDMTVDEFLKERKRNTRKSLSEHRYSI